MLNYSNQNSLSDFILIYYIIMLHFIKDFNAKEQITGIVAYKGKPTPVLDLFRSSGEKLRAEKISHFEKFGILEDGNLAAAIADNAATSVVVNEALAKFIDVGYQISIEDENMIVTAVNTSTNTLTVVRGYADTPKSAHANGTKVYVIAKSEAEWTVTEDYKKSKTVEVINYLQEWTKSVKITRRAKDLSYKDTTSLEADETAIKLNEEGQEMERAVLYSVGKLDANNWRNSISGLKELITKYGGKVVDAQGDLTDEKFDLIFAELRNKGSEVDTIILNPLSLNKVFKKLQNVYRVSNDQNKQIGGGVMVGYMPSTMGGNVIKFVASTTVREKDIFIVDSSKLFFLPTVDKNSGSNNVFDIVNETNENSAIVNKTIRTEGTIDVQQLHTMAYIANAWA